MRFLHFRKQQRLILLVCLRIRICAQFTLRGLPLCPRIFNWLSVSAVNVLRALLQFGESIL
ncbi:hypothetical protein RYX36_018089, partial [Vicia faba]